jgi:hypothetical protein
MSSVCREILSLCGTIPIQYRVRFLACFCQPCRVVASRHWPRATAECLVHHQTQHGRIWLHLTTLACKLHKGFAFQVPVSCQAHWNFDLWPAFRRMLLRWRTDLFCLQGNTYSIPVSTTILADYPIMAPECFVGPTSTISLVLQHTSLPKC